MWDDAHRRRGPLTEYDAGPDPEFARLFAQTPHYLSIGAAFGDAPFRWHFGPIFYRGRTAPGSAKVLVIGQEGAQDESLAHRSFTGTTGGVLQDFLHTIGITHSYLFLNTFVYPINGQYDGDFPTLAQDPRSPIAAHRGRILDHAAATLDLRLVIAVGRAAKETCVSWLQAHGGHGAPNRLSAADASVIRPGLRMVGVTHPGSIGTATTEAEKQAAIAAVTADFTAALGSVRDWAARDAGWLPVDDGARRASKYTFGVAPVPHRDFPFGLSWRLGVGTSSGVRRDLQRSIELPAKGAGEASGVRYTIGPGSRTGYSADRGDVVVEPPRRSPLEFDPGPGDFAALLSGSEPGLDWPDFSTMGLFADPSFGFGPSYRGRLTEPSVLVLADQASQDDLFLARALTGEAGQRLQTWLAAAGLTRSYAILRTLPVDSLGADSAAVQAAVSHPAVVAVHRETVRRAKPRAVVALGRFAGSIVDDVTPLGVPVVRMSAWADTPTVRAGWQTALTALRDVRYPRDVAASFVWNGRRGQIPRDDLPYGTLRWQGTSGDRAARGSRPGFYKITMPAWAVAAPPPPMTAAEARAVAELRQG
ncbi:uracil-DNA glycosylase family protein [Spongisporangium articulatum]|uniref:Uracil-DNA glycosylase family protein n=1 Tax=Spongisporangium articulatum TaxID=3362603 RepID=A0ABW8AGS0_9ACTN